MNEAAVEWSVEMDPDLAITAWSTAALLAAVIEALLEEPEKLLCPRGYRFITTTSFTARMP